MTIKERYDAIKKIGFEVRAPWSVARCFSSSGQSITISSDMICLGEDYVSLDEARQAIEWYVTQLGGKVKWEKEKSQ